MGTIEETVEWWKAIVESMNDGVLVIDRAGVVKIINPEYTQITGVTPDIIGNPLISYCPGGKVSCFPCDYCVGKSTWEYLR